MLKEKHKTGTANWDNSDDDEVLAHAKCGFLLLRVILLILLQVHFFIKPVAEPKKMFSSCGLQIPGPIVFALVSLFFCIFLTPLFKDAHYLATVQVHTNNKRNAESSTRLQPNLCCQK